jgi:hypothetical protein
MDERQGFARCVTARTSYQGGCEGDDQVSLDCRDRVCDMSFGADRQRLGVDDFWKCQASRIDRRRRRRLRGEVSPARRSGRHRRRCTAWRDDGSRASRAPRSVPGPVPVSARQRNFARSTRRSKGMSGGTVASQYLAGSASPWGHSISSHSSSRGSVRHSSRWAGRTRTRAKREVSAPAVPSRQETVCQLAAGKLSASALTLTGWCSVSRRISFGRRPRPDHGSGASGAVPGGHTEVCKGMPAI